MGTIANIRTRRLDRLPGRTFGRCSGKPLVVYTIGRRRVQSHRRDQNELTIGDCRWPERRRARAVSAADRAMSGTEDAGDHTW
jgi:hypothetical protein